MTQPDLDELVALARRDRPAPGALMAVARNLRVPFATLPVAAMVVPSTAFGSVVAKVGLSRLALLGWSAGSTVVVSGVVAAVALHEPPPVAPPEPPAAAHVAKHLETPPAVQPSAEPPAVAPAPSAERHVPTGLATWDEPQLIERAPRRRALAFEARYPKSIHLPQVRALLARLDAQ